MQTEHPLVLWRKLHGLSRRQLAKKLGMPESTLRWIEGGNPTSMEKAARLSRASGIDLHAFVRGSV
jgi:transcriptional regulator with XRE-family HTH domain